MMESHRVFVDLQARIHCGSCGQDFADLDGAKAHLLNGGSKALLPTGMYPCLEDGCARSFESEQGRSVHVARSHSRAVG